MVRPVPRVPPCRRQNEDARFAELVRELPSLLGAPEDAALRGIAPAGQARPEFETPIITPFVVPTVLASLWCLLRHPSSWSRRVADAIRLGGDVDTLGAIVGALAGVREGEHAIPPHLREAVVDADHLRSLALRFDALIAQRSARP